MSFVQIEFLWFMVAVFALYWAIPRRTPQNVLLLVASAIFYGWIHPWFLILLYAASVLDFFAALGMARWPGHRGRLLALSVAGNLLMLGTFKYLDFFLVNVDAALGAIGLSPGLEVLGIALPAGISFYTFQTMSYTIDVYRGELKPRSNFLDYIVFVGFFPQLVAGPIERATHLLPQVEHARTFRLADVRSGVGLALRGAFKKVVIADTLAPYVDKVYGLDDPQWPLLWAATLAFTFQILCDFSGYTDIARGTARTLGFDIVENFDHPFLSASTPELWRRWHMSLSTWIRDYLWIPLLGSTGKVGNGRFVWATVVTFVLVGFWHGPSWNFVLLGLWISAWILLYTYLTPLVPKRLQDSRAAHALAVAFHCAIPGCGMGLLFRERQVADLWHHVQLNPFAASREQWIAATILLAVTLVMTSPLLAMLLTERHVVPRIEKSPFFLAAQTTTWTFYAVAMFVFYRMEVTDFVYFQF